MNINFSQELSIFLHILCQWLGTTIGFYMYRKSLKQKTNEIKSHSLFLFFIALSGAGFGLKLGSFIEDPTIYLNETSIIKILSSGGTIVGAILGAYFFIEIYKKINNIKESSGDYLVFGLMIGIIFGRLGCFLAGQYDATYGNQTDSIFGVYFGEEFKRHPTQLYEIIFLMCLYGVISYFKSELLKINGLIFKIFAANYFLWRLIVDGMKPINYFYNVFGIDLSGIQLISLVATIYFYVLIINAIFKSQKCAKIEKI